MDSNLTGREVKIYIGVISELTSPITGIIESSNDIWVVLKQKRNTQYIKIDKISRIVFKN